MDNKAFTTELATRMNRSTKDVSALIDGLVTVIKNKSDEMDSIAIPSFGSFEPKKRLERVVNNPATGKKMLIPPKISLSFKVSNILKNKMREA